MTTKKLEKGCGNSTIIEAGSHLCEKRDLCNECKVELAYQKGFDKAKQKYNIIYLSDVAEFLNMPPSKVRKLMMENQAEPFSKTGSGR